MADEELNKTYVMKGIGVSPGIVIGKAYLFDRQDAQVPFYKIGEPALVAKEIQRFCMLGQKKNKILLRKTDTQKFY